MNVIKTRKYTTVLILLFTLLALGIGYAIVSTDLHIGGNITTQSPGSDPDDTSNLEQNFIVKWNDTVKEINDSNAYGATANVVIVDEKTVSIDVSSFSKLYSSITVKLQIDNDSIDLIANIAKPVITNSQSDYFNVSIDWTDGATVNPQGYVEVYVTFQMIKSPIVQITGAFSITFTAEAEEV